jgi:hypothetical protein
MHGEKIQTKLFPGYTPTMPKSNLMMDDHSMWYYNKNGTITVLMWYNLTTMADTHWRKRWFRHLLGDESEVLLRRSMFPKEDAVVRLLITQKSKSNKKKFVLSYPTGQLMTYSVVTLPCRLTSLDFNAIMLLQLRTNLEHIRPLEFLVPCQPDIPSALPRLN